MQSESKLFDDLAKLASGALGSLQGFKGEIDLLVKQRVERLIATMELVPREEFEAVKEMAIAARAENEALMKRIKKLETPSKTAPAKKSSTKPKPKAKKAAAKKR